MKQLSLKLLSETVSTHRKAKGLTQVQVSKMTDINRTLLSRLEAQDYTPSIDQLLALSEVLVFDPAAMLVDPEATASIPVEKQYKIAVAGTGYVGLSLAVLLSQHNTVTAVDIVPEKVEKLNNYVSPNLPQKLPVRQYHKCGPELRGSVQPD